MWNYSEIDYLEKNYTTMGAKFCANALNRSIDAVFIKARRLGLAGRKNSIINGCKTCSKCKTAKPVNEFHRSVKFKSGFNSSCTLCWQKYCALNASKISNTRKIYQQEHKKELLEKKKSYLRVKRSTDPQWRVRHNLRRRLHHALKGSKKSSSTLSLLGCTLAEFKSHLEAKFQVGMNWTNYGKIWHIDHIIPCVAFDLTDSSEQEKCFHFSNLQPLFAVENLKKGSKR